MSKKEIADLLRKFHELKIKVKMIDSAQAALQAEYHRMEEVDLSEWPSTEDHNALCNKINHLETRMDSLEHIISCKEPQHNVLNVRDPQTAVIAGYMKYSAVADLLRNLAIKLRQNINENTSTSFDYGIRIAADVLNLEADKIEQYDQNVKPIN